jgi:hypothetical protein
MQDRDTIRKQNAQVQEPHASHFKLTQQALGQSGGRILNPLEVTQVGQVGPCLCFLLLCFQSIWGSAVWFTVRAGIVNIVCECVAGSLCACGCVEHFLQTTY